MAFARTVKALAFCAGLAATVSGCQTTDAPTTRHTNDPNQTYYGLPKGYEDHPIFSFVDAETKTENKGSIQTINFSSGFLDVQTTRQGRLSGWAFSTSGSAAYIRGVVNQSPRGVFIVEPKETTIPIAEITYATYVTNDPDNATCFIMEGFTGKAVDLRSGKGRSTRLMSIFCAKGVVEDFDRHVLSFLSKLKY